MNTLLKGTFFSLIMLAFVAKLPAQVPQIISYQGRVGVDGVNFDGSGQFKFAFVNAAGTTTYWSNDGSSTAGSEPGTAINIPVSKGLYAVLLGDATLTHMSIVPATVFTNSDVHLRVWFSDGVNGFQQLTPDRRIAAVGYAMIADSVSDGAITTAKIADGAITSTKLAPDVMQATNAATSVNNPGTIIKRDANGNFSAGTITAAAFLGKGVVPWVVVSGTSQQAEPNTGYLATNTNELTITLPTSPAVGDVLRIAGAGPGGWKIAQNTGQFIVSGQKPGTAWTARENDRSWTCIASSADGTKLVAGAGGGQLYTSSDSGVSWFPRAINRSWTGVCSSSDGSMLAAVAASGQVYTSDDSGLTWTARDTDRNWSCIASSADGTKLVAAVRGGKIYKSTNSGATWSEAYFFETQWNAISSSADGTRLLASAEGVLLVRSSDSGSSWIGVSNGIGNSGQPWKAVSMSANGQTMVAVGSSIFVSTDAGFTWIERYPRYPFSSANSVACSADGSKIFLPGLQSFDSGLNWMSSSQDGRAIASSADGSKLVILVSGGRIYTSVTVTTIGGLGYLRGGASSSVELIYSGNGCFIPISFVGSLYPY